MLSALFGSGTGENSSQAPLISVSYRVRPNPAVDLAPFGRRTLRDIAVQRRSPWPL